MLKNIFKSKWLWIIIIILAIGGYFYYKNSQKPTVTYLTELVKRSQLTQTVSATGEVESATETNLTFKASGRIVSLPAVVGQKVKTGQLLARLDSGRAASNVNQARAALLSAQANLNKIQSGASTEDIAVSQESINQAQASLDNAIKMKDQGIVNLKESIIQKMQHSVSGLEEAIKKTKDLLLDGSYSQSLGNLNIQLFYDARNQFSTAQAGLDLAKAAYSGVNNQSNQDQLNAAAGVILAQQTAAKVLLDKTYQVLLNSTVTSLMPQTVIDAQKTIIGAEQTNVYSDITTLQTAKDSLSSSVLSYEKSVTDAKQALELAKAQFNLKTAKPRDFDLKYYEAAVLQAQANLQAASSDLADYSLVAPQDGIITKVNNKIGEQAGPVQAVISMIAESNLQIKVDVPESDIVKVKAGNATAITLDAYGQDRKFPGHVTFVDPAATNIQDVVYYKVTVAFDNQEEVKSGMTANVVFDTAKKDSVLVIPARAINEDSAGRKFVKVLVNNKPQEKTVVLGLRGDEGLIEIVSGLSEGENVITFIKDSAKK